MRPPGQQAYSCDSHNICIAAHKALQPVNSNMDNDDLCCMLCNTLKHIEEEVHKTMETDVS